MTEETRKDAPEEKDVPAAPDGVDEVDDTAKEAATPTPDAEETAEGTHKDSKRKIRRLESEIAELKKKLEESDAARAADKDQYLRLAAEYDNFRKRSAKERETVYTDAYAEALTALFPVVDNLERAAQYGDSESVSKGVAMTLKSISEALEKMGVCEIGGAGEPFDPTLHNAVLHVEDETLGENVVAEVLQKGYRKGDRVLRYAMVKVAN